jgi:drug/metabolite transporter superfamily protein YnfA
MIMKTLLLMAAAAILEVGGDAMIRVGLRGSGWLLMAMGAAVLVSYGFMVNFTSLNFGKLMGLYIVLFFVVAQIVAILFFGESPPLPVAVGGLLIVVGGLTMACWQTS